MWHPAASRLAMPARNFANNPSRLNFDMALAKRFKIMESGQLEFRAEAFNIFNRTQFRIYDPTILRAPATSSSVAMPVRLILRDFAGSSANCVTGASFLHPIDAHRPRTVQFGFKFSF